MVDMNEVITTLAVFIKYATVIVVTLGVAKAGLSIIYRAITGKDW